METTTQNTETRTEKGTFAGKETLFNFNNEKLISIEVDGITKRVCESKYETLYEFTDGKIKLALHSKDTKIIPENEMLIIDSNQLILKRVNSYFRSAVYLKNEEEFVRVTIVSFDPSGNPCALPFGKYAIGDVSIQRCTDYKGESRIIVTYLIKSLYNHKIHGGKNLKEVKFLSELPEKSYFNLNLFPKKEKATYIVVK